MTYDAIKSAMEQAGFFTSHDAHVGRLICASMLRREGGLTGNSFWIAQRQSGWFLGTWGPHFYRIPDPQRIPELCATWLRRQPRITAADVDDYIHGEFHLVELEEFPDE